jgi:hypothetical protein
MNATAVADPTFAVIENHKVKFEALRQINGSWADEAAFGDANEAEMKALDDLCCLPPATIDGARAAIEYVMAVEDAQQVPAARAYLENLLASPLLLA